MKWLALMVLVALPGCGDDETSLRPLDAGPTPPVDAGVDAKPPVDSAAPIRTVEQRNPFGHTTLTKNLMVDGDFELTSGSGQYGWRAIGSGGSATLIRETGGLCRSGVTCGVLTPDVDFLGMAAAPKDQPMDITLWAKPPEADCGLTGVSLISCTSLIVSPIASVPPDSATPDESGWCRYHAVAPAMSQSPCLFVEPLYLTDGRILVDDVSIVPAPAGASSVLSATVPTESQLTRMRRAIKTVLDERRL